MKSMQMNAPSAHGASGVQVRVTSRFTAEYRDGDKVVDIDVEPGVDDDGKLCVLLALDAFKRWRGGTPISSGERRLMLQTFVDAMRSDGLSVLMATPDGTDLLPGLLRNPSE